MEVIAFLVIFPFFTAFILSFLKRQSKFRSGLIITNCAITIGAVLYFVVMSLIKGHNQEYLKETKQIDSIIWLVEIGLMGLLVYFGFRYKKYYIAMLSVAQTALISWMDFTVKSEDETSHIFSDDLTLIMCLIIGIVGCLICVYAVGYMKEYHKKHAEYKDRSAFFFAMLFVFLGAMFGLVFSNNLKWIYLFWEITTICSFLLIGYTKTDEAINNSFKALWINLLGGLGFAVAIVYSAFQLNVFDLHGLVALGAGNTVIAIIPVVLLGFAAITKSAQLPFSGWLLGAMVAPTPTSALLHSATMVKAGVYLLIRLSPSFAGSLSGLMITTIGGFTFLAASFLAISQSDAKKVLAYSTVSNLGLITACAGIGTHEAVWAAILLMMFHAISKSLMFLTVGSVENNIGSRDIEDMHGLIVKLPELAFVMIVGIAGMFLAPFGMLISKWAALKAFIDNDNILLVVFLIFGSAGTLFYWTKWLGKLVAVIHNSERRPGSVGKSEWFSLLTQSFIMIALCISFPLASKYLVEPFLGDMFHETIPAIISKGNINIMLLMLCAIVILPFAVRFLTFGKKNKVVISYMGGANSGDDRHFIDSFGNDKAMYLTNWYMDDYFGERKILKPSVYLSSAGLVTFLIVVIGGAL
ncbi:MAG: NADH-quinone oxidoreductase subunit 5 family protein [Saccharofermentanales bacterium]